MLPLSEAELIEIDRQAANAAIFLERERRRCERLGLDSDKYMRAAGATLLNVDRLIAEVRRLYAADNT